MKIRLLVISLIFISVASCVNQYVRLPSSAMQVYSNTDIQQSLMLLAQNNVLVHIPEATTREFEKTEIDQKCFVNEEPLWSEKLSSYLSDLRRHPEYLSRINIIELVRSDRSEVVVQNDLDGAVALSIRFNKFENYGKVTFQSKIPCNNSVAEYLGQELIKTRYNFPTTEKLFEVLSVLPEKKETPRFKFKNNFLTYLAERGTLFKFNHDTSFEKTTKGQYVLPEIMNQLAAEVKEPFHQHLNYWFKQIHQQSAQAKLIQMFAVVPDDTLNAGVKVDSLNNQEAIDPNESDLTYLYITYKIDKNIISFANLQQLDLCLKSFTDGMGIMSLRKPASTEKASYLRPGYSCQY